MSRSNFKNNRSRWNLVLATVLTLLVAPVLAEELVVSEHAIVNTGHHIYMRSCSVCHGRDARGAGPYAPMLVVAPSDLTTLSKANEGRFPFEQVLEIISGNELMPAHGSRDMPIWGQEFEHEAETLGVDARSLVRGRMLELVSYLQYIQQD
ncbi:MAG: cytochrome c [Gammaproteobacteria bacterium]|jgi:mono/diheme cytochrome c family protein|nr:cytochrome c [Gammaproteobacteria bacterium]